MDLLEIHVTFSRAMFGPDVPASVTFEELKTLIEGIRFIEAMKANPVDKEAASEDAAGLRAMFMKGLVAAVDIKEGERLDERNLDARKPMAGISVARYDEVVGKRARRALQAGTFLQERTSSDMLSTVPQAMGDALPGRERVSDIAFLALSSRRP